MGLQRSIAAHEEIGLVLGFQNGGVVLKLKKLLAEVADEIGIFHFRPRHKKTRR